jgi:hypothetical protein
MGKKQHGLLLDETKCHSDNDPSKNIAAYATVISGVLSENIAEHIVEGREKLCHVTEELLSLRVSDHHGDRNQSSCSPDSLG